MMVASRRKQLPFSSGNAKEGRIFQTMFRQVQKISLCETGLFTLSLSKKERKKNVEVSVEFSKAFSSIVRWAEPECWPGRGGNQESTQPGQRQRFPVTVGPAGKRRVYGMRPMGKASNKRQKSRQEAFTREPGRLFPGNTKDLLTGQVGSRSGGCRQALGFGKQGDDSILVPQGHLRGSLPLQQRP